MPSSEENINPNDIAKVSETELNLFFEYSLDIMILIGFDNRIKQVSPSFERILGWKKQEVISKCFQDFLHPDDIQKSNAEAKAHETGENAVRFENRYRCKDGSYRWISWNSHPLLEKQIVVGIGRDITERKKAEEALRTSEEKYRTLFDSMTEGFVLGRTIYNKNGKPVDHVFLEANEAFEKQTGIKKEIILNRPVTQAIPGIEKDPAD